MRILILGASGYTGKFIKEYLTGKADAVYGTYRTQKEEYENDPSMFLYDVEKEDGLHHILMQTNPEVIVSCLRGDFVQQLEAHKVMISYLRQIPHGKLVFLSTSNVFDNDLIKIHSECDVPDAESDYGKYKAECEKLVLSELGEKAIILRPSFIMGKNCRRSEQLLTCIKKGRPVPTYENIEFNYTPVIQIAEWLWYILEHNLSGIFHVGTKDTCGYTEFLRQLVNGLMLPEPEYAVEYIPEKSYQAVIPTRKEIPDAMQITIKEAILYLQKVIEDMGGD